MKRFKFANKLFTMTLSMVLAFGLCVPGALASTVDKAQADSTSSTIEKGHLWQKEKGDLSAFEGSDYSHENIPVDIKTANVTGAGTDVDVVFAICYEDGTIERAFADHVTVTGGNKFE
ncbi:MAG: hypothetical protein HUJ63_10320, partial [Enterococcus sp.]|nr:hypothetical protein [Enterococcus sp.]